jgi:sulfoxide reductase heme-binding subunit YedZ
MAFLRERNGAWCPEKVIAFVGVLLPAFWIGYRFWTDDLGARPVTEVIHFTGDWTVRILWLTLAVSPMARIFRAGRLLGARRILGVASFTYAFCHLSLYTLDQKFNFVTVATEIALRFYLTIGFVALLGLATLAATSTDAMVRRLGGPRWAWLHKLCYPVAALAQIHFLLQSKNDIWEPTLMLGFLLWMFGFRLLQKRVREVTLLTLIGLGVVSSVLTVIIETGWYYFRTGVDAKRVFLANFDFSYIIRPSWYVLAVTLAIVVAAWLWRLRPQTATVRSNKSSAVSGATRAQSAS